MCVPTSLVRMDATICRKAEGLSDSINCCCPKQRSPADSGVKKLPSSSRANTGLPKPPTLGEVALRSNDGEGEDAGGESPCSRPVPPPKQKDPTRMSRAASFLVDIPSRWEPRAKQQPTGLIAYSADWRRQSRPVRALYRPPWNGIHPGRRSWTPPTTH